MVHVTKVSPHRGGVKIPYAEETPKVPQGQAYGAAKRQTDYIAATAAPRPEKPILAPEERPIPNVHEGFNLDDVLFGPTQRPGEPVTQGLGQAPPPPKIADLLAAAPQSPDVQFLGEIARGLGL